MLCRGQGGDRPSAALSDTLTAPGSRSVPPLPSGCPLGCQHWHGHLGGIFAVHLSFGAGWRREGQFDPVLTTIQGERYAQWRPACGQRYAIEQYVFILLGKQPFSLDHYGVMGVLNRYLCAEAGPVCGQGGGDAQASSLPTYPQDALDTGLVHPARCPRVPCPAATSAVWRH